MQNLVALKDRVGEVTSSFSNSPDGPGAILDFSCISLELVCGKHRASWVFNMNAEEFFSNKPLPGSKQADKWQYEELQELKTYLVELCRQVQ